MGRLEQGPDGSFAFVNDLDSPFMKNPSLMPAMPDDFYKHIGMVALAWSQYELVFDHLLAALIYDAGDASKPNWRKENYPARKKYCLKLIGRQLRMHSGLAKYLRDTIVMSDELQEKRNSLLHGIVISELDNVNPRCPQFSIRVEARAEISKRQQTTFSATDLEKLAYDILHIGGRLLKSDDRTFPGLSGRNSRKFYALVSKIPLEGTILPILPD